MKNRDYAFFCSLAVGVILAAGLFLYEIWGKDSWIFPACPIYKYLGIWCPGCGFTRAVKSLLAGDFFQSLSWNPMPLYSITLWCLFTLEKARERILPVQRRVPLALWKGGIRLGLLIWILFTLWRNI